MWEKNKLYQVLFLKVCTLVPVFCHCICCCWHFVFTSETGSVLHSIWLAECWDSKCFWPAERNVWKCSSWWWSAGNYLGHRKWCCDWLKIPRPLIDINITILEILSLGKCPQKSHRRLDIYYSSLNSVIISLKYGR